jgi:hypothetical protein
LQRGWAEYIPAGNFDDFGKELAPLRWAGSIFPPERPDRRETRRNEAEQEEKLAVEGL